MASYSRYSHHARRALTHAGLLVTRYHHPELDTAHLLVGIMLTEGSIGHQVLSELNLRAERAEELLPALFPHEENPTEANEESIATALQLAADEAAWLGSHYIGTEHMLLGITRTNTGKASLLLRLLHVSPETVRRHVRRAVNDGLTEFSLQKTRRKARLSELSRRVITAAEQMSIALDHPTVGIGHLLLVLLMEKRSQTCAILEKSGLDPERLRADLDAADEDLLVSIEEVLEQALEVAEGLGDHYTGTDHLLLVLTLDPAGMQLLRRYKLPPDRIRRRLETLLRRQR